MTKEELMATDFGAEMEKQAAEKVAALQEAYAYGMSKLAKDVADAKDEEEKEDSKEDSKEDKKEKMDEESEKAAAELGAFIERGFFDGLRKEGMDRHGDEMHYVEPFLMSKIAFKANEGAIEATKRILKSMSPSSIVNQAKAGAKGVSTGSKILKSDAAATNAGHIAERAQAVKDYGKKQLGMAALKASPYAALGAGTVYGGAKAIGGKKEDSKE